MAALPEPTQIGGRNFLLLRNNLFLGGPAYKCGPLDHPGTIAIHDCNGDGLVDLSDAICKLSWLFLGGPTPFPFMNADADGCLTVECEDPTSDC